VEFSNQGGAAGGVREDPDSTEHFSERVHIHQKAMHLADARSGFAVTAEEAAQMHRACSEWLRKRGIKQQNFGHLNYGKRLGHKT
jgi:hypothetical protein